MWLFWCKLSRTKDLRRVDSINQCFASLRINLAFEVLTQLFDKFSIYIRMQENVRKTTGETRMRRHKSHGTFPINIIQQGLIHTELLAFDHTGLLEPPSHLPSK